MEGQKYCVYNQTRESFLSLGVTVADAAAGGANELIERGSIKPDSGLWMNPYRGILPTPFQSPVDLVYLDGSYRVIQEIESFPTSAIEPLRDKVRSALVLPAHTIYSSQTQLGDQMVICVAEEMEHRLERLSGSFASLSSSQTAGLPKDRLASNGITGDTSTSQPSDAQIELHESVRTSDSKLKVVKHNSLIRWIQNWLSPDRRRADRQPLPGIVAYYWTGGTPRAYPISDISSSGFYLLTEERWFPGTMVLMTLQRTDRAGKNLEDSIAVQSKVVRWGSDGLGLAFVLSRAVDPNNAEFLRENGSDKKTLDRFLDRLKTFEEEFRAPMR
jgi:uncharacterized membrane protein (UPF0127 family)